MNTKSDVISVDTGALRNKTIPTTTRSKTNIAKAINCFDKLTMPKNFSQESELNNIISRLKLVEKDVNGIITYINEEIEKFDKVEKNAQAMVASLNWNLSYQGGGLPNVGYSGYGTVVTNPQGVLEQLKNAGITVPGIYPTFLNLEVAASKGLVQLGESIVDGTLSTLAEKASVLNWMFNSPINKKNMEKMQKATMSFVSKDYTKNLYDFLYSDKFKIGKKIDDYSFVKKDSNISNFVTDITSGGALFKFAEAAGPYGKIATAALGFLKGKGESAQTYWSQSDVKSQIENGKNISTIFKKGSIYSDVKGLWSAVSTTFQAATGAGGKVDSVLNAPWKRVLADSAMGGADVLIDTITGVVVDKKNVKQAFKDAGGLEAIGYKALTAGAISSVGELARWGIGKVGGKKQNINNRDIYESVEYKSSSKINLNEDISGVVRKEHLTEFENTVYSKSDERFMQRAKQTGSYTMDQDVTHELFYFVDSDGRQYRQKTEEFFEALENKKQLEIRFTPEYYKLEDYLTNSEYKMSKRDAMRTISMINTNTGTCELVATHDAIFQVFGGDPEKYTQATGLTISKSNVEDAQKLTDYFIYSNNDESYHFDISKPNGIFYDNKGKTEIMDNSNTTTFANGLSTTNSRNTNIGFMRINETEINEYIQANSGKGKIEAKEFIKLSRTSKEDYVEVMKRVQKYLDDDNKGIILGLGKDIPLIRKNNGEWQAVYKSQHYTVITGVTEQGVVVGTYGKRSFISHKSLQGKNAHLWIIGEKK